MIIKQLTLFTNTLEAEKEFYNKILGFDLLTEESDSFSVQVGLSQLIFTRSVTEHIYHYCFLIPSNQLNDAIEWLKKRLTIFEIEEGRITQKFESWNAESVYFFDASGNLAEFIVRYDLDNQSDEIFDLFSILSVNEIGIPNHDIAAISQELEAKAGIKFWKGDLERFGTQGTQKGLFLLPNLNVKKVWFPTQSVVVNAEPIEVVVLNDGNEYKVEYKRGKLDILCLKKS